MDSSGVPIWTSASVASSTEGRSVASTLSSATSPWVNGRMSTSRAGSTCGLPPPCTEPVTTAIWVSIAEPLALPSTVQFAMPNSTAC